MNDLHAYCLELAKRAKRAAAEVARRQGPKNRSGCGVAPSCWANGR
jgi:hypothetical protein